MVNRSNTYDDVKDFVVVNEVPENRDLSLNFSQDTIQIENGRIILGIKNVTKDSGSTSLVYMLKRHSKKFIKKMLLLLKLINVILFFIMRKICIQ